ncbi:hypothetical protein [Methylopila sp. 73B]|uniref:hypothetical protein n=1 Tax=Methylopila sp. 73B TaxID=1120792 RepID=UPI0012DC84A2|nr:hypothetical protein [Methylopila sp. 73B]
MTESVLLINLRTGETMVADAYALRERGLPEGWHVAASVSIDEWISALRAAVGRHGGDNGEG